MHLGCLKRSKKKTVSFPNDWGLPVEMNDAHEEQDASTVACFRTTSCIYEQHLGTGSQRRGGAAIQKQSDGMEMQNISEAFDWIWKERQTPKTAQ